MRFVDEAIFEKVSAIPGFGPGRDIFAFYEHLIELAPPGATIAEVGCFHGRSLAYLALAARRADKGIKVIGSDWMRGQAGDAVNGPLGDALLRNLVAMGVFAAPPRVTGVPGYGGGGATLDYLLGDFQRTGLIDRMTLDITEAGIVLAGGPPADAPVRLLVNKSELAAAFVPDGSLWAVFIDDDHEEENVRKSCGAWFPKVMPGGVFSGHDYQWPGPNAVVKEWYPRHEVFEVSAADARVEHDTRDIFWFTKS